MDDLKIVCHNCNAEIKLTESIAAPMLESTRRQYEQKMAQQNEGINKREMALQEQQDALVQAQQAIDQKVAEKLQAERQNIETAEAKKAQESVAFELNMIRQEKAATDERLHDRETRLAEAQANELALRRERQELKEEKERFELDKQREIDQVRAKIREHALKDADEQARLKIAEKDKIISDLDGKLQDALRKAQQGSQQLQGEIQELMLEDLLRVNFHCVATCFQPIWSALWHDLMGIEKNKKLERCLVDKAA